MLNTKKLYFFNLLIKILPPSKLSSFKVRLLRWCGASIGDNVSIFTPSIQGNFNLIIGDNVWIGHETLIFGAKDSTIEIGKYAKIASRAIVVTGYHEYSTRYPNIVGPGKFENVIIKEGATIGTLAMVLPGKSIGYKSHVAAGSVVTHDVPDFVRVAGVPARIIKEFAKYE